MVFWMRPVCQPRSLLWASLALVSLGCQSMTREAVRDRAVVDLACDASYVSVSDVDEDTYRAHGCGKQAIYDAPEACHRRDDCTVVLRSRTLPGLGTIPANISPAAEALMPGQMTPQPAPRPMPAQPKDIRTF